MKKLLISLLCMSSLQVFAQTEVVIDFKTKLVNQPKTSELCKNKIVRVKIVNLPVSNYKVSINKTDSVVSIGTAPGLFSVFSFGDGFNSLLAGLSSYTVHSTAPVSVVGADDAGPDRAPANAKKKKPTLRDVNGKSKVRIINPCYSPDAADINSLITKTRNEIFDFHYSFRDEVIKEADNLMYKVSLDEFKAGQNFKDLAEKIIALRLKKDKELEKKYVEYYDKILKLESYDLVRSCAALKAGDSMLAVYKRNFDLFLNRFDTTFNETLIAKVHKQLNPPVPVTEFLSLPYRLNGDITKFAIDIVGIDASKTPQSYSTVIELEKHPQRLWSFTTGVFVSGLKNDEFSIVANVKPSVANPAKLDTMNYSLLQEKNNGVGVGINALMHFGGYFSESNDLGGFVTFGPGLTLEKTPQVRVMIGGGLMFGRTNKLALSFGWTGGPVKRKADSYSLTSTYNPAPTDITRDKFGGSWFVSLGYAIFGK